MNHKFNDIWFLCSSGYFRLACEFFFYLSVMAGFPEVIKYSENAPDTRNISSSQEALKALFESRVLLRY